MSRSQWLGPAFHAPAKRVISLVPSLTESLFMLGAGDLLTGRTEYCVKPEDKVQEVETFGGTKNILIEKILAAAPDLVLANKEENVRRQVTAVAERIPVLLTDPLAPEDAIDLWSELGLATGQVGKSEELADDVRKALDKAKIYTKHLPALRTPFIYFVWKDPWMVAGHKTYISNLLWKCGFGNALPYGFDRFPPIEPDECFDCLPYVYFYSTEPYPFELPRDLIVPPDATITALDPHWFEIGEDSFATLVDAEKLSWYPSQTAEGLHYAMMLRTRMKKLLRLR